MLKKALQKFKPTLFSKYFKEYTIKVIKKVFLNYFTMLIFVADVAVAAAIVDVVLRDQS